MSQDKELYRLTLQVVDLEAPVASLDLDEGVIVWTLDDQHAAEAEGWALFESGTYGIEIERDDDAGRFASDDAAIEFCLCKASDDSALHARALAFHFANIAAREAVT